jgi:hypothetical protein
MESGEKTGGEKFERAEGCLGKSFCPSSFCQQIGLFAPHLVPGLESLLSDFSVSLEKGNRCPARMLLRV